MELEKEIKQDHFRNEYHKLTVNIIYTYSWLNSFISSRFVKYKITVQQYNILRILRGQHPKAATVNLLKERMLDKMSDASRIVERLRTKGLVSRKTCLSDRRKVDIIITKKGLNLLKKLDDLDSEFDDFLQNLSPQETRKLNNLLDKLRG